MATRSDPAAPLAARPVFVIGTGRCGSTLVHEVLARHRDVGFVSNIEDNLPMLGLRGRFNADLYRWLPPGLSRKGRLRYAPSEAYRVLDAQVSPVLSTPFRDLVAADATPWLAASLRGWFAERMASQARPVFLHKFTGWPRARFLAAVFPEARFVHIVRDGRAVANSWLQMPWWPGYGGPQRWSFGPLDPAEQAEFDAADRSFVTLAGLGWRRLMAAFDAARAELADGDWLELRYEDILADPAARFDEMLRFAGLSPGPEFDAARERYRFSTGRSEAFRRDLGPDGVGELDRVLGPMLAAHGYH